MMLHIKNYQNLLVFHEVIGEKSGTFFIETQCSLRHSQQSCLVLSYSHTHTRLVCQSDMESFESERDVSFRCNSAR